MPIIAGFWMVFRAKALSHLIRCVVVSVNSSSCSSPRMRVSDSTGTPLNVRALPGGSIQSTLSNGTIVT
jgi:hypothetical protein